MISFLCKFDIILKEFYQTKDNRTSHKQNFSQTKQLTKMNNNEDSPLCVLFVLILSLIVLCSHNADMDENGMDSYDRSWGIAGEGRERGVTGIIYTNGQFDIMLKISL